MIELNGHGHIPLIRTPEMEASDLLDDAVNVITTELSNGIGAFASPVACRAAATRIVQRFANMTLTAIRGDRDSDRLARFFREERPDLGFEGDVSDWTPVESAMRFLRREARPSVVAALNQISAVRPSNWEDDDDPDQLAAWRAVDAALAACKGAGVDATPSPGAPSTP
ncbi:hypothetical protein [Sphingomonas alpina]|uniref:Uncharacterized protein n=1 Tax=Sphingomonas alpina TaxID=653931 RepID=A0A7H0LHY9_9SPHN|nr:hypothetical protein [Sphingomonas alpina]QNQ09292.1 hypothetical protein H3Z74_21900 [Sphingomonas alpina]